MCPAGTPSNCQDSWTQICRSPTSSTLIAFAVVRVVRPPTRERRQSKQRAVKHRGSQAPMRRLFVMRPVSDWFL